MNKNQKILIINAGSATLKFKIFTAELKEEIAGIIERIGMKDSFLELQESNQPNFFRQNYPGGVKNHEQAVDKMLAALKKILSQVEIIGHRVVHGGEEFQQVTRLNSVIIQQLAEYNHLAPLHNPINLACIRKLSQILPKLDQYAVFDTAYFSTMPEYIYRYALPNRLYTQNKIRRYGFHGVSHQSAVIQGAKKAKVSLTSSKIVSCHLGSGCSVTATLNGHALATSMGFTPLEGLVMSTRSGDLDASIPLYLLSELKMDMSQVTQILNEQSGLLGIAGTKDMRDILAAAGHKVEGYDIDRQFTSEQQASAKLALDMFIYSITKYIGQYHVLLKGLDLLVFTGGIGERSGVIRKMVTQQIRHLGKFKTTVIPANEELVIAQQILTV